MPLLQGFRSCRIQRLKTMNGIYAFAARVPWNLCLRGKGSVRVGFNDSKQWMESMPSRQGFLRFSVESMPKYEWVWQHLLTTQSCFKTETVFFSFHSGSEMIKSRRRILQFEKRGNMPSSGWNASENSSDTRFKYTSKIRKQIMQGIWNFIGAILAADPPPAYMRWEFMTSGEKKLWTQHELCDPSVFTLCGDLVQCVYQDCVPSSNADNLEILLLSQVKSNYTSNFNYGTNHCLSLSQITETHHFK
jgi:hypothetical protein